ncbi:MAG TPA: hypothetical protein DCG06_15250 [Deltaproteobacteria bacterium]|nr:hypothetical protein [Deltaproteobacteria bacterium]
MAACAAHGWLIRAELRSIGGTSAQILARSSLSGLFLRGFFLAWELQLSLSLRFRKFPRHRRSHDPISCPKPDSTNQNLRFSDSRAS